MRYIVTDRLKTEKDVSVKRYSDETPKSHAAQETVLAARKLFIVFEDGDLPDWQEEYTAYPPDVWSRTPGTRKTRTWRPASLVATWPRSSNGRWVANTPMLNYDNVRVSGERGQKNKQVILYYPRQEERLSQVVLAVIEQHDPIRAVHLPFALDDVKENV